MNALRRAGGWLAAGWFVLVAVSGCASKPADSTGAATRGGGQAVVTFVNPEQFTDVVLTDRSREASRAIVLPEFERTLRESASRELPTGFRLDLRITDMDLAGWIRPTRDGRRMRIVRDGLPARIKFEYTLSDAAGRAVETGRKTLSRLPSESVALANVDPQTTALLNDMMASWLKSLARKLPPAAAR